VRDSGALCEYLCWLEEEVPKSENKLNEVTAADKLDSLRRLVSDPSFRCHRCCIWDGRDRNRDWRDMDWDRRDRDWNRRDRDWFRRDRDRD